MINNKKQISISRAYVTARLVISDCSSKKIFLAMADIMKTYYNTLLIKENGQFVEWPKRTIALCVLRDGSNKIKQIFVKENTPDQHAEIHVIAHLSQVQSNSDVTNVNDLADILYKVVGRNHLTMFLNYSPCDKCCQALTVFLNNSNLATCEIIFTALYYGGGDFLRVLANHPIVTLSTFYGNVQGHGMEHGQEVWVEYETWNAFTYYLHKCQQANIQSCLAMIDADGRRRDKQQRDALYEILNAKK